MPRSGATCTIRPYTIWPKPRRCRSPVWPNRASSPRSSSASAPCRPPTWTMSAARLHRLGSPRLRDRAVAVSRLEISRRRYGCGQRPARRAVDRTAARGRIAPPDWQKTLADFAIELSCDGQVIDRGVAANVLTGRCRRCAISSTCWRTSVNHPLAAREIVTTGTLTRAMPVHAGETWSTTLSGIALDGIRLRFA